MEIKPSVNKLRFAYNLRYQMKKLGLVQADIMRIAGVSQSTASEWSTARKMPRMEKIQALADSFGIKLSALLDFPEEGFDPEIYAAVLKSNPDYMQVEETEVDDEVLQPYIDLLKEKAGLKRLIASTRYLNEKQISNLLHVADKMGDEKVDESQDS